MSEVKAQFYIIIYVPLVQVVVVLFLAYQIVAGLKSVLLVASTKKTEFQIKKKIRQIKINIYRTC